MANAHTDGSSDILVAGGGAVGMTLALALAREGFSVALAQGETRATAGRCFFIAFGCWRIWRALGLESALTPGAQPVSRIEAEANADGAAAFDATDGGEDALGFLVEERLINDVLRHAVEAEHRIESLRGEASALTFGDVDAEASIAGELHRSALIVGCDGVRSRVRRAAGLRFEGWDYPAAAISAIVNLDRPHEGCARQAFLRTGPLAVLPLTMGRANIVWTERAAVAEALVGLSDQDFAEELRRRAGSFIGPFDLAGPRGAFPIGLHVAERMHAKRVALAGDAAHQIPPLAGQGLNLGLKDVAALVDVVARASRIGLDIGSEAVLEEYSRWRRADVAAMAAAMEGFTRIFTAPEPIRGLASAAMRIATRSDAARRWFAREAGGVAGELPTLMRA